MNKKKLLYYLLFFIALTIAFQVFIFKGTDFFNKSPLSKRSKVENFSFINQDGVPFTNTNMEGKVCVVNYFFTTCKGICPKMNNNMKLIYEAFKNEPDFLIISSTCNPGTDSVSVIKHYADSLKVDTKKWVFLTGKKDSLYNIARNSYGIDDPKRALANIDDDFIHTQFFALVDKNGNVRGGVYDGLKKDEIEKLKKDIKGLLAEKQIY
ncbi:MAG: SCO family protein [Bacteroidetes bacterium]|nr:SCO family protein [Bacteroidota bacterium]MBS1669939.1 SCO family protein [Bacteroidota bacterium]